jgi:hypothetical protein
MGSPFPSDLGDWFILALSVQQALESKNALRCRLVDEAQLTHQRR